MFSISIKLVCIIYNLVGIWRRFFKKLDFCTVGHKFSAIFVDTISYKVKIVYFHESKNSTTVNPFERPITKSVIDQKIVHLTTMTRAS